MINYYHIMMFGVSPSINNLENISNLYTEIFNKNINNNNKKIVKIKILIIIIKKT